jgi:hypothetical protein
VTGQLSRLKSCRGCDEEFGRRRRQRRCTSGTNGADAVAAWAGAVVGEIGPRYWGAQCSLALSTPRMMSRLGLACYSGLGEIDLGRSNPSQSRHRSPSRIASWIRLLLEARRWRIDRPAHHNVDRSSPTRRLCCNLYKCDLTCPQSCRCCVLVRPNAPAKGLPPHVGRGRRGTRPSDCPYSSGLVVGLGLPARGVSVGGLRVAGDHPGRGSFEHPRQVQLAIHWRASWQPRWSC